MPRPRLLGTVLPPRSVLDKYPEHVQAIGMISVEIANLEILLGELLAALLHVDPHFGRLVYLTPQSFAGRLSILKNVTSDTLVENTSGRKHIDRLIEKAERLIVKRHRMIHDSWGTDATNPKKIVRRSLPYKESNPAKPVPISDLTDMVEDIRGLCDEVMKATKDAFASWPPYTWQEKSSAQVAGDHVPKDTQPPPQPPKGKGSHPTRKPPP